MVKLAVGGETSHTGGCWASRAGSASPASEKISACFKILSYHRNFALTCPIRPALALVTRPKLPLVKLPLGLPKLACSRALKNSARISNDMLSRNFVVFSAPQSKFSCPGPWKKRGDEVPCPPSASEVKAALLKYVWLGVFFTSFVITSGPTKFGRSTPEPPISERSPLCDMLMGNPVASRVMPLIAQPWVRRLGSTPSTRSNGTL